MKSSTHSLWRAFGALVFGGVATVAISCESPPPITTVDSVDLARFMGDWYVIAHLPASIEENAFNAIESYRLDEDGTVATMYTFREGAFDGSHEEYAATGHVYDKESNAVWGMQFFWPFKAEYRVLYLTDDYTQTVIGRTKRDYVWIMAREPAIPKDDYDCMLKFLEAEGYDLSGLRKVPQQPLEEREPRFPEKS